MKYFYYVFFVELWKKKNDGTTNLLSNDKSNINYINIFVRIIYKQIVD